MKICDWNTVSTDAAGCYITIGQHRDGSSYGPVFICISQCLSLANRLGNGGPLGLNSLKDVDVTMENARSIAIKLQTELSNRVLTAAIELLQSEVVTTENAREIASLQEAVLFKTGKSYGPELPD